MGKRKLRRARADDTGRNDGERFIPIPYTMARSAAWRSLSGAAIKVWCELRSRFNGINNGDLSLSCDEGARLLGLGKATILRAFGELEAKGFIKLSQRGQWYGRTATTWTVTDRPHRGHLATRDWRTWTPPRPTSKTASRFRDGTIGPVDGSI